jgi:hypothetical protein
MDSPTDAAYSHVRRFGEMFEAALENPTPPTIVAEKIREIIENSTQKLRHPVGPDAEGFLGWRASMSDEDWIEWGALSDDAWYERVKNDFGLDARAKRRPATVVSRRRLAPACKPGPRARRKRNPPQNDGTRSRNHMELVDQTGVSWNRIVVWLIQLDTLRACGIETSA